MHKLTIAQLSQKLSNKEISSVELTQQYIDRIKKIDPQLNSFISILEDTAIATAAQADATIAAGNHTALTGIPLAYKDIFCTEGVKTSCGSKMLDNFIAPYESTVTEKLHQAGVVPLGKTNMDEFAMGSSNESSFYGPVKNPWNLETVPGGSSGGSAAAVAARISAGAIGTDTGGSIRQPAALCGITGLKPTYGRVSRWGMIAFASSLDQGGPMAQTAEDCGLILQQMAGFDTKDSTSINKPVPNYLENINQDIKGLKIGLPKEFFSTDYNADIQTIVQQSIQELEKLGAEMVEVSLPHSELAIPAYYVIAPAECSSNLSRLDGVRYGHRCEDPTDLNDLYRRSRSEGFGDEVKRRIMIGTYALSAGYYDAYYIKAQKIRRLIKQDFEKAFSEVDMILSPTTPDTAFKIGEKANDPVQMYLSDIFTIAVNLVGLPAISMPAGFSNNLPVGVQLIGQYFDEGRILNAAHQYQKNTQWHQKIPDAFA